MGLSCNLPTTATQAVDVSPSATPTTAAGITPTETNTSEPATNATCNELSFYLDPDLATSYHCETVPESNGPTPFVIYPQYTKVSLEGYVLSDRFMKPVISVFPVQKYGQMLPDPVIADVAALQALIAGGAPGSNDLPLLPPQYARQLFFAQYGIVAFRNGSGFRIVTEYAQAYYPVTNHEMFFSYQGITTDGKYWISIILPISHPSLPENGDNPPADLTTNPDPYYAQMTSQLNAVLPKSFNPSIVKLGALIKSITIQP
jgi:hypothetical protein